MRRSAGAVLAVGAVMAVTIMGCGEGDGSASDEAARDREEVRTVVDRQVTEYLRTDPELASYYGVPAERAGGPYADRLVDYAPAAEEARRALIAGFVEELDALPRDELAADELLTLDVARSVWDAMAASRDIPYGRQYPLWYYGHTPYVVNQISGPHIDVPNLMANQQAVGTQEEAEAYLTRLRAIGPTFDGVIRKLRADAAAGVTAPRVLLERTLEVLDGIVATPPEDSDLVTTLSTKLEASELSDEERRRVLADATDAVEEVVLPAYGRLRETVARLAAEARTESGVWALPEGEAFYRASIRALGGSDLGPEEIHALGLAEVGRIEAEIDSLLRSQGRVDGTVGQRLRALGEDPTFLYPATDEGRATLIADLEAQVAAAEALVPDWFGTDPPQAVVVRRVPEFSQETAPTGYYDPPPLDGSRPGVYWVNLRDMEALASWTLPTLSYHEAVPGHHHQIATALSAGDAPLIRRLSPLNAYVEGWALYAERLAWEMGLYEEDPFGDIGRLKDELWRAVRLVVDTGLHHERWTREEAIDYMASTTGTAPSSVRAEIERYMAWPGQALGYKMGMIRILELREEAREALGDAFDIRAFHDVVLLSGAVPMEVLEARVSAWVEEVRADD